MYLFADLLTNNCRDRLCSLVLVVSLGLLVGCSGETSQPVQDSCEGADCPGEQNNDDQAECQIRTDCDIGEICQDGECVSEPECQRDRDCPGSEVCKDGGCFPGPDDEPDVKDEDTSDTDDTEKAQDGGETRQDCPGCYLTAAEATCVDGDSSDNCGEGGAICQSCTGDQICTTDGECELPPSCNPTNCDGCCQDGECKEGTSKEACGTDGAQCQTCDITGQSCDNGSCTTPCSSQSCPNGCCTEEGECKTEQNSTWCGTGGESCSSCAENATCDSGECIEVGCKQSCQGCCRDGNCLTGQDADACGESGESCVDCTPGRTCTNRACKVEEDSSWDLQILWAEIPLKNAEDEYWDPFNGTVDPYIIVAASTSSDVFEGETTQKDDTANPLWPGGTVVSDVPDSALVGEDVSVTVMDDDGSFNEDDTVVQCQLSFSDSDFDGEEFQRTCTPVDPTTNQVDVDLGLLLKHR